MKGNYLGEVVMVNRDRYLKQIIDYMWDGQVKVITGIRRSGKSVLLFELFKNYLLEDGVLEENIIMIELDKRKGAKYRNPIKLCEYVEGMIEGKEQQYYLFIDEIQFCREVIDSEADDEVITIYDMLNELKDYKNLDIYVTGSNSKMLSKDILTEFRGRSSQIHVNPFSFKEYYEVVGGEKREAFDEYMLYGGMPYLIHLKTDKQKKDYLDRLFKEVYIKDIVERERIEREDILSDMLDYLSSSISSLTNPTNITNAINSIKNDHVSPNTVNCYLEYLKEAFLISEARRYDVKGKKYFEYPNKYYYVDIGLRNARVNFRQFDSGHIMENIIYNELISRGYSVDVGVVTDRRKGQNVQKEIDFVVNSADKRVYIQSAYEMHMTDKINSELDSLLLSKDFFKKIIIRSDIPRTFMDENGIIHQNIIDFLLNDKELF